MCLKVCLISSLPGAQCHLYTRGSDVTSWLCVHNQVPFIGFHPPNSECRTTKRAHVGITGRSIPETAQQLCSAPFVRSAEGVRVSMVQHIVTANRR